MEKISKHSLRVLVKSAHGVCDTEVREHNTWEGMAPTLIQRRALYLRDIVFHRELLLYTQTHYMDHEEIEGERVERLLALEFNTWAGSVMRSCGYRQVRLLWP